MSLTDQIIAVSKQVHVGPFQLDDVTALVQYLNVRDVHDNTCHIPFPYTKEEASKFVNSTFEKGDKSLQWAIRNKQDKLIGGIGFMGQHLKCGVYEFSDEIGYWLAKEDWGKGIMTQVVEQVVAYGFDKLKLMRIEARVFTINPASAKVLEKCGFELEGIQKKTFYKNGKFLDSFIYARLRA